MLPQSKDMDLEKSMHVIPAGKGRWGVYRRGSARMTKVFRSEEDALLYAMGNAAIVYLHAKNGRIERRIALKPHA